MGASGCSLFHATFRFGMLLASTLVTHRLGDGRRCAWCTSMCARLVSESLATTAPMGIGSNASGEAVSGEWIASISCAVLEPGAAHMSSTKWCGFTSRNSGGSIDTASCREMLPTSVSCTSSCWKRLNSGDLRSTFLRTSRCQPRPSGYHSSWRGGVTFSPSNSTLFRNGR